MTKKKVSKKKTSEKMRGPKTKISSKKCQTYCSKNKDINVVVPIPAPIPINVPLTIPTNLKIIDRLKSIKDKVFSTFGFGPPEIPND